MRKIRLLFLVFVPLAICSTALGQVNRYEAGIEAGPTRGSLRGDWIKNSAIRYSGGLSFQYNYSRLLSFRTNIAYERKSYGGRQQAPDGSDAGKEFLHFNYLTLPLLARLTLGNKVRYFINAGPYAGFLIYSQSVYDTPASTGLADEAENLTEFYKRFDAGFTAGLGSQLPLSDRLLLSLELRNNLGLVRINNTVLKTKINSTSLLLGLAYQFRDGD